MAQSTVTINLRAQPNEKKLIECAANAEGISVTNFVLESACRHAQEVLLEHCIHKLTDKKYSELLSLLEPSRPRESSLNPLLLKTGTEG